MENMTFDAVLFFEYLESSFDIDRLKRRFELATDVVYNDRVPFEYADPNLYNDLLETLEEYAEDHEIDLEALLEDIDLEKVMWDIFSNLK